MVIHTLELTWNDICVVTDFSSIVNIFEIRTW